MEIKWYEWAEKKCFSPDALNGEHLSTTHEDEKTIYCVNCENVLGEVQDADNYRCTVCNKTFRNIKPKCLFCNSQGNEIIKSLSSSEPELDKYDTACDCVIVPTTPAQDQELKRTEGTELGKALIRTIYNNSNEHIADADCTKCNGSGIKGKTAEDNLPKLVSVGQEEWSKLDRCSKCQAKLESKGEVLVCPNCRKRYVRKSD